MQRTPRLDRLRHAHPLPHQAHQPTIRQNIPDQPTGRTFIQRTGSDHENRPPPSQLSISSCRDRHFTDRPSRRDPLRPASHHHPARHPARRAATPKKLRHPLQFVRKGLARLASVIFHQPDPAGMKAPAHPQNRVPATPPPSPATPHPSLSARLAFRADPLAALERHAATDRPIAPLFPEPATDQIHLVNDPALVAAVLRDPAFLKWNSFTGIAETLGAGLVTSAEPLHGTVRRAVQPAFHSNQIENWTRTMRAMATEAIDTQLPPGTTDLVPFLERLTLRIAGRILFALDLTDTAADILATVTELQHFHDSRDYAHPARLRFDAANLRLDELLRGTLASQPHARNEGPIFRHLAETPGMTPEQDLAEFRGLLLAGTITISTALAAACVRLAECADSSESPKTDDATLDAIILETLRLDPPVWFLFRQATEPGTLGDRRYNPGDKLLVSPWTLHRRAATFPDPLEFRPARWRDDLERKLPSGAFIPFSLGARSCIGARFARLEATIILRALLETYRFGPAPDRPPLDWRPLITLVPKNGAWIDLSRTSPDQLSE